MAKRSKGLIARFRRAVQSEEQAQREQQQAAERARARALADRAELLRELAEMGRELALGPVRHAQPGQEGEVVTLTRGDRTLSFTADDPEERVEVAVSFEGQGDEMFRLYREPQLEERWVLSFTRRGRAHRLPLFDVGLEELLILALDLPRPSDEDDGESSANAGEPPQRKL